ncbi:hypothetical protein AB1A64_13230 [Ruegeria sp. ANG10]|uniref:hypothetical protein n=1 Tax=Ruegeria sp. ANG10 TaxID=3042467 RepID=UPI0034554096
MQKLKLVVSAASTVLLTSCDYGGETAQVAVGSEVGGTGKITYDHEQLAPKKHLLTVKVHPGLGESEASMKKRQRVFALKFAAEACGGDFQFPNDPTLEQDIEGGLVQRTKVFLFDCV